MRQREKAQQYVWADGDNGYYSTKENLIKKLKLDYLSEKYNNYDKEISYDENVFKIIKEKYKSTTPTLKG